jgi:hypothetical protein
MKYRTTVAFIFSCMLASACSTTIPLQSNLSSQTLLEAGNKNIKAAYVLNSKVPDGKIREVYFKKNGKPSRSKEYNYKPTTAFKQMWSSYFDNKFNKFADDQMKITATLKNLYLEQHSSTSVGAQLFTGDNDSNVKAVGAVDVAVEYKGKTYQHEIIVSSTDYQETKSTKYGTFHNKNPKGLRSTLLENALNSSIIQFDNYVRQILAADK